MKLEKKLVWPLIQAYQLGTQQNVEPAQRIPNYKRFLQYKAKREGRRRDAYTRWLIFSESTYEDYKQIAELFARFLRDRCGVRDVGEIRREQIRGFVEYGVKERNWRKSYARLVGSALTKIGRRIGRTQLFEKPSHAPLRGHEFPEPRPIRVISDSKVVQAVEWLKDHAASEGRILAVLVRVEVGLRLAESTSGWQWFDDGGEFVIKDIGDSQRALLVVPCGKGGKERFAGYVSRELAMHLKSYFERTKGAKLDNDYDGHRFAWRSACQAIGGAPTNTHSTRHRHARKMYLKLSRQGYGPEQAVREISRILGHGPRRPDITQLYLGVGGAANRAPHLGALLLAWDRLLEKLKGGNSNDASDLDRAGDLRPLPVPILWALCDE